MNIIEQMRGEFLAEAGELLDEINGDLVHLEDEEPGGVAQRVHKAMRAAHSLKGSSGMFGLDDLSAASHSLEGMLEDLHRGGIEGAADLIEASIDMLEVMRQFLHEAVTAAGPTRNEPTRAAPVSAMPHVAPPPGEWDRASDPTRFLRIDLAYADRALNLVGDLFLETALLKEVQKTLVQGRDQRSAYRGQITAVRQIDRRLTDLRECLLEMRMVPLGRVFQQLIPAVRSVAKTKHKQVDLDIEGGQTRLDKVMADRLYDSLLHLVRNAIDHGVEEPSLREERGKPTQGRILLCARREGAEVAIEIRDDGGGIELETVLAKARAQGLLPVDTPVGERQILECLFAPGLSTASQVDAVSGRGVGMDVVRSNVARLSGTVSILTEVGRGTAVIIRVPPTLSTMDGLLVGVGGQALVFPFYSVTEVVRIPADQREGVLDQGVLKIRDEAVPAVPLGPFLGLDGASGDDLFGVVVGRDSDRFAILVDMLGERTEILVKPLGPRLDSLPILSGVTELADGRAALVLDAVSLAKGAMELDGFGG